MIRVTMELVSAITPERSRLLGVGIIANDGKGTAKICNYDAAFSKGQPHITLEDAARLRTSATMGNKDVWRRGRVESFDRVRYGGWDLVCLALLSAIGPERGMRILAGTRARP